MQFEWCLGAKRKIYCTSLWMDLHPKVASKVGLHQQKFPEQLLFLWTLEGRNNPLQHVRSSHGVFIGWLLPFGNRNNNNNNSSNNNNNNVATTTLQQQRCNNNNNNSKNNNNNKSHHKNHHKNKNKNKNNNNNNSNKKETNFWLAKVK